MVMVMVVARVRAMVWNAGDEGWRSRKGGCVEGQAKRIDRFRTGACQRVD